MNILEGSSSPRTNVAPEGAEVSVQGVLEKIMEVFSNLGAGFATERTCTQELWERLTGARFHLAVLGQFKRGKSTLLNALLGEPLLPSAVVPVTSVPTLLSWGQSPRVQVHFRGGKAVDLMPKGEGAIPQMLAQYVTEEGNPKNSKGVAHVEVQHSSPLLHQGVVLIDTPGIGSTFVHNTDAALAFLPHCDAALFVVSADPPITQVELEFLRAVRSKVVRLFFVLNKVDYLADEERQLVVAFLRQVLKEEVSNDSSEPIFAVSARQGLEARLKGDRSLWHKSGMDRLERHLVEFLAREKQRALEQAIARKAEDTLADGLLRLRLHQRALTLPMDDLERRVKEFEQVLQEAERQRVHAKDLLAGDRLRSLEFLDQQAHRLRDPARGELVRVVEQALQGDERPDILEGRARARLAQRVEELFDEALNAIARAVAGQVQDVFGAHQTRVSELVESVRRTAAELFDIPYGAPTSGDVVEVKHQPYWVTERWDTAFGAIPTGPLERLLPRGIRIQRLRKHLLEEVETVVLRNIENARWAMVQNIEDTHRRFSADLDQQMEHVIQTTQGAIKGASRRRAEHAREVATDIERLGHFEAQMQGLLDELKTL